MLYTGCVLQRRWTMAEMLGGVFGGFVATALCTLVGLIVLWVMLGGVRIVNQVERGVVFRLGRALGRVRQPGLTVIIPLVDRLRKVNVQIVTLPVPSQEGITRDNVSVKV